MVRTDILCDHLRHYEEETAARREDHLDANARTRLEEVIAFANFIFDRIHHVDVEWTAEMVRTGEEPLEPDARAVANLYAGWCQKAEENLARAAQFERDGHDVAGVEEFREKYREARLILSVPVDRARQSIQQLKEGRTRPLGEVLDGLRHRLNSSG